MEKKKVILYAVMFIVGLMVAFYVEKQEAVFLQGYQLERNQAGDGSKELTLWVEGEGLSKGYQYELTLEEMYLTEEEATEKIELAIQEIDEDFADIAEKVPMKERYQNGLVEATWSFDVPGCIDQEGYILQDEIPEEGLLVNAKVALSCQRYEMFHFFSFRIEKQELTKKEILLKSIDDYIKNQMETEGTQQFFLPEEINGIALNWKEEKDHLVPKVALLEVIIVVLLIFSEIEKKKQKEREHKESLELDYPEITGQLSILVGAGMSISQGFSRIAAQYLEQRKRGMVQKKDGFEELVYANYRMQEGESEREALMRLGSRVTNKCYHRLIRILLTNKDKGTGDLCKALETEAQAAYEQRVLFVKKKGEEASTKMLVPLMLMMVLVMIIVMLPAIIEFGA